MSDTHSRITLPHNEVRIFWDQQDRRSLLCILAWKDSVAGGSWEACFQPSKYPSDISNPLETTELSANLTGLKVMSQINTINVALMKCPEVFEWWTKCIFKRRRETNAQSADSGSFVSANRTYPLPASPKQSQQSAVFDVHPLKPGLPETEPDSKAYVESLLRCHESAKTRPDRNKIPPDVQAMFEHLMNSPADETETMRESSTVADSAVKNEE